MTKSIDHDLRRRVERQLDDVEYIISTGDVGDVLEAYSKLAADVRALLAEIERREGHE